MNQFSDLLYKTIITINGLEKGSGVATFETEDGKIYKMFHSQDCCETVDIEDVIGDVEDLYNSEILLAEVVTSDGEPKDIYDKSCLWTFYKLSTIKGSVTIRWYGQSDYYSLEVDFQEVS